MSTENMENELRLLDQGIEAWKSRYYGSPTTEEMSHCLTSMFELLRRRRALKEQMEKLYG